MVHLNTEERFKIYEMHKIGYGSRKIGSELSRGKSTINYELKRMLKYRPDLAEIDSKKKRLSKKRKKLDQDTELRDKIISDLKVGKSPDSISGRMKYEGVKQRVSTETIYQYIYNSEFAKKEKTYLQLARQRKGRLHHGDRKRQKRHSIPDRVSIAERPDRDKLREEVGNLEGDLTFNKGNQSMNISALADIKSQKVFLVKNNSKKSELVISNINKVLKKIEKYLKSMTFDNGKEFTFHKDLLPNSKRKVYFCNAYSPWQKPLVEKINSMIHRLYPKTKDITKLSNRELRKIENTLNNLPRRALGYKTPNEVWNENLIMA